jgi:hypothetical protein
MTSGERMIWAAEFVRMMAPFQKDDESRLRAAIRAASEAVDALHVVDRADLRDGERAKLDDMQGVPR